jgi:hypothetical protein
MPAPLNRLEQRSDTDDDAESGGGGHAFNGVPASDADGTRPATQPAEVFLVTPAKVRPCHEDQNHPDGGTLPTSGDATRSTYRSIAIDRSQSGLSRMIRSPAPDPRPSPESSAASGSFMAGRASCPEVSNAEALATFGCFLG